jgi:hypothetical protein
MLRLIISPISIDPSNFTFKVIGRSLTAEIDISYFSNFFFIVSYDYLAPKVIDGAGKF